MKAPALRMIGRQKRSRGGSPLATLGLVEGYRLEQAGYPLSVALDGIRFDLQRGAVAAYLSLNTIRNFTPNQFFSFTSNIIVPSATPSQRPGLPARPGSWRRKAVVYQL